MYCTYDQQEQTAERLLASIMLQLAQQKSDVDTAVKELYDTYSQAQSRPTLDDYARTIRCQTTSFSRVFVLVDALDDCPDVGQVRASFLRVLQGLLPTISLLATSRELPSIETWFTGASRMEIQAQDGDVKLTIKARIAEEPLLRDYVAEDVSVLHTITGVIIENAKGM